jgi:antirestriction protein
MLRPRIYVASLSDYNNGSLHGSWIDANQSAAHLYDDIDAMLARSPDPLAEEWAIHDHDGFGGIQISEYESVDTISRLAAGLSEHGPAFAGLVSLLGSEAATSRTFEQHYRGHWTSLEDYADDLLRDLGAEDILEQIPAWIRPYLQLDVARFARDLSLNGDLHVSDASEGGVHVFDTVA